MQSKTVSTRIARAERLVALNRILPTRGSMFVDDIRTGLGIAGASLPGFIRATGLRRTPQTIKHKLGQARGRKVHAYARTAAFRRQVEAAKKFLAQVTANNVTQVQQDTNHLTD